MNHKNLIALTTRFLKKAQIAFFLLCSYSAIADNCLEFDGEKYCQAWTHSEDLFDTIEFVLEGESLETWTTLVTVRHYHPKDAYKQILQVYVEGIKLFLAANIEFFRADESKYKENIYLAMLLQAPEKSRSEYVIHRFYLDDLGITRSVYFSYKITGSTDAAIDYILEQRKAWFDGLKAVDVASLIEKP